MTTTAAEMAILATTHQLRTSPNVVPSPSTTPVATAASPIGIESHGAVSIVRWRTGGSEGSSVNAASSPQNATTTATPNQPTEVRMCAHRTTLWARRRSRKPGASIAKLAQKA